MLSCGRDCSRFNRKRGSRGSSGRAAVLEWENRGGVRLRVARAGRSSGRSRTGRRDFGTRFRLRIHGFDAINVGIRNFPTEIIPFATLLEMLLEKNGAAGVRDKGPRGRKKHIA